MSAEPQGAPDLFETLVEVRRAGLRAALATVIGTRGSTPGKETMRLLVVEDGRVLGTVGGGCVEADVIELARDVLDRDTPRRVTFRLTERETGASGLMCGGELDVFVEPVTAPALVLFGGGHISRDLCEIASRAGFRVSVVDDRVQFANPARFPSAVATYAAESFPAAFESLDIRPTTYCVVVTRGHAMDTECTAFALRTAARYVGLIGSKVKVRSILHRLRDDGTLDGVDLDRLHAPIGLDLGGGTHGEIAVSIVAELIAHRRGNRDMHRHKRLGVEAYTRIAERGVASEPEGSSA